MMQRGFQLFETAVAISLLLIAAGWSTLTTRRVLAEQRLNSACVAIVSAAAAARAIAITRDNDMQLAVRSLSREFALAPLHREPAGWKSLPAGVSFASVPARSVTFHGRGTAAPAGTLRITNESGTLGIVVAVSGRVRWFRE